MPHLGPSTSSSRAGTAGALTKKQTRSRRWRRNELEPPPGPGAHDVGEMRRRRRRPRPGFSRSEDRAGRVHAGNARQETARSNRSTGTAAPTDPTPGHRPEHERTRRARRRDPRHRASAHRAARPVRSRPTPDVPALGRSDQPNDAPNSATGADPDRPRLVVLSGRQTTTPAARARLGSRVEQDRRKLVLSPADNRRSRRRQAVHAAGSSSCRVRLWYQRIVATRSRFIEVPISSHVRP